MLPTQYMSRPVATLLLACSAWAASAGNWPAWRGPDGNGICRETGLPLLWSSTRNVRWRVALLDRGNSTPIVWDDSVFITQALEEDHRRTVTSGASPSNKTVDVNAASCIWKLLVTAGIGQIRATIVTRNCPIADEQKVRGLVPRSRRKRPRCGLGAGDYQ